VQPFLEGKRGRRRGSSTVPEADDTAKSGSRHLEVKDDQRKLSRRAECVIGLNC
jgi:hypothetical protein